MAKRTCIWLSTDWFSLATTALLALRSHDDYHAADKNRNLRQNTHTHRWVSERKGKTVKGTYRRQISSNYNQFKYTK